MTHVHTFLDAYHVQRVTGNAADCDYCKVTPVAEPEVEHYSCDYQPIKVGAKFWSNDLRVIEVTEVAVYSNKYSDTGCIQTWHRTTEGNGKHGGEFDTLSGSMQQYGRLVRYYMGRDAEKYEPGTNYADIKGKS